MVYNEAVAAERRNRDRLRLEVSNNPVNHEAWLAYIALEQSTGATRNRIGELFRRAVSIVPPVPQGLHLEDLEAAKRLRRFYVELWIQYATFEDKHGGDAAQVCEQFLAHDKFSSAKVWFHAADLKLQRRNLKGARMVLSRALTVAPKHKIFLSYIDMELKLGNVNRCRKLYDKYLCWMPHNVEGWIKWAEFERALGETERVRALFEIGIDQEMLDRPEMLWKTYIDFETSEGETERARQVYEKLLERTKHVMVWSSYAQFEAQENHSLENARKVFRRAADCYWTETEDLRQEWLKFEASLGDLGDVSLVQSYLPTEKTQNRLTCQRRRHRIEDSDEDL